jgi:hypothetical protein
LRGIAPGDDKLFSWEELESDAWQDPDFLKPFKNQGEKWVAGRTHEIAQNGHIRPIRTDATSIHRQAETLGQIEINAGIV